MPIHVCNEIGRLKRVLLHRPGAELEQLTPDSLDQLLFDDIPYLKAAQKEHDYFAAVLRSHDVEVVYLADLLAETLAQSSALKERFVADLIAASGGAARHYEAELTRLLLALPTEQALVLKAMAGVNISELTGGRGPLTDILAHPAQFALEPIPNLYFTRDPFASIGHGVSLNRMFSRTRNRETIFARYLLSHHPDYADQVPFYYRPDAPFHIEGGDILNLSAQVLAVGLSQRTSPEAVELLAQNLFADPACAVTTILCLDIPNLRAYMHLDTVFTQVDVDKFTIHPGILPALSIYILRKSGNGGHFRAEICHRDLQSTLRETLRLDDCRLIRCGGQDQVAAAREQWNDGANTLAVAPGTVVVYDRNQVTNRILAEEGLQVLEIPSSELSRGRGGPRCMSMPLWREDIPRSR